MNKVFNKIIFPLAFLAMILASCNVWDDHLESKGTRLEGSVLSALKNRADLSTFYQMVVATGYDTILTGAVEVTVLAPSNEALASYANATPEEKKSLVKNHIAFYSYSSAELSKMDNVTMLNGKKLDLKVVNIDATVRDLLCDNGILHKVDNAVQSTLNLFEYVSSLQKGTYPQVDSIMGQTKKVMDMDRSIQTGYKNNKPVYDTVWVTQNHLLDRVKIQNEDSSYTLVVLTADNYNQLSQKYAKYMQQKTETETDSLVFDEIYSDLIFKGNDPTNAVSKAVSGVNVDFSKASVVSEYKASNGTVRVMKGVDIKIYNNKIKEFTVQGEDYSGTYNLSYVSVRSRPWASGGKDVMVSSRTTQAITGVVNGTGVSTSWNFYYPGLRTNSSATVSTATNFYLEYKARLYSANYDVYWVAHSDYSSHIGVYPGMSNDSLHVEQKMYVSYPSYPSLYRASNGEIKNNTLGVNNQFAGECCLYGMTVAGKINPATGKPYETKLRKYRMLTDAATQYISTSVANYDGIIECPRAGLATFFVTNTATGMVSGTDTGGLMFLDYIRFVPKVDVND
ncbi:fasciclin domain-containing protein [Parabacteroides sp. FAFU027]|uniref:fasciclin domain-containing protein n=1 Tax=Parabacteroides sp. FAFU027 TaxID=2922715 RepID=UPI001FAF199B|nr:fasciclin domain-containing protein [Parabacteroides sp. FAFU027]